MIVAGRPLRDPDRSASIVLGVFWKKPSNVFWDFPFWLPEADFTSSAGVAGKLELDFPFAIVGQ